MEGAVEKMGGGVGGPSAGGAQVVRGPADPLEVRFEGRTEPRAKLGQGGTVRAGEGSLFVRDGWGRGLEDPVMGSGSYCCCCCLAPNSTRCASFRRLGVRRPEAR